MAIDAVQLNQALLIAIQLVVSLYKKILQVLNALIFSLEIFEVAIKVTKFRKESIKSCLTHFLNFFWVKFLHLYIFAFLYQQLRNL